MLHWVHAYKSSVFFLNESSATQWFFAPLAPPFFSINRLFFVENMYDVKCAHSQVRQRIFKNYECTAKELCNERNAVHFWVQWLRWMKVLESTLYSKVNVSLSMTTTAYICNVSPDYCKARPTRMTVCLLRFTAHDLRTNFRLRQCILQIRV